MKSQESEGNRGRRGEEMNTWKKAVLSPHLKDLLPFDKYRNGLETVAHKAGIQLDAIRAWYDGRGQPSAYELLLLWEQFPHLISPGDLIFRSVRGKNELELEERLKSRFKRLSCDNWDFDALDEIGKRIVHRNRVWVFGVDESDLFGAKRVLARCAADVFVELVTWAREALNDELAKRQDHLRIGLSDGSTVFEMASQIPLARQMAISLHALECQPANCDKAIYPSNEICCMLHDRLKLERDRLHLARRAEDVRSALDCHFAVTGIGTPDDDGPLANIAEPDYVMSVLRKKYNAVGECNWILLDREGTDRPDKESGFVPRVQRVELRDIRDHMTERGRGLIGVAVGAAKKSEALLAHLNGEGVLTGVVISTKLAESVLDLR